MLSLSFKSRDVNFDLLNRAGITIFIHFLHFTFCLFGFLEECPFGTDHGLAGGESLLVSLEGEFDLFEEVLELAVVNHAGIILFSKLLVESLKLSNLFFLVCIFSLQRNEVFEHV